MFMGFIFCQYGSKILMPKMRTPQFLSSKRGRNFSVKAKTRNIHVQMTFLATNCVLCGFILLLHVCCTSSKLMTEDVPTTNVQAAEGGVARLPCDITPAVAEDKPLLVIWYREDLKAPIYSFDARTSPLAGAVRWQDERALSQRAVFLYKRPSALVIENVREADAAVYRCRVDFRRSPTRNYKVNFTVIVPPKRIIFLDGNGETIPHYTVGPYNEGSTVEITCIAVGGRPPPRVTWWQDNTLLTDRWEVISHERVRNKLRLQQLSRRQLHAVLTCQAESSPLAAPVAGSITLDLNLRPLSVRIRGRNRPLSADAPVEVDCEAVGTRPPPVFSWWKAGVQLRNTRETSSPDGNVTTSTLTFVPTMEDSGKLLTCRASTPLIPDSSLEDSWKLDIYHVPVVSLEIGSKLDPSNIREGQDVYFECNIKSNPWVYKVSWRHNGKPLHNNASTGTILANQSLVLQAVTRDRAGIYTCVGSNHEGDGESNPVYLNVTYRPLCSENQQLTYGVARREAVRVSCEVDANPSHGLSFSWSFNGSADERELPAAAWSVERGRSLLLYTPRAEADYGQLLCRARNAVGTQRAPCVFQVVPAGRPDPPHNCSIVNQTADSLHVECSEGFDGGLPQEFVMEVYDAASQALVGNVSSRAPAFTVSGLQPGLGFDVALLAANSKGRSRAVTLHAYTLQPPERRAASAGVGRLAPLLGVVAGCAVLAVLLAAAVATLIVRTRRRRRLRGYDKAANCDSGLTDAYSSGKEAAEAAAVAAAAGAGVAGSRDSIDDKNPDVVPHNSDADVQDDDDDDTGGVGGGRHGRHPSGGGGVGGGPASHVRYVTRNGDEVTYIELPAPRAPQAVAVTAPPTPAPRPTVRFQDEVVALEPGEVGPYGARPGYSSLQRHGHRPHPHHQPQQARPHAVRRPSAEGLHLGRPLHLHQPVLTAQEATVGAPGLLQVPIRGGATRF
ncbi:nephrin-like [Schistocerca nitens]|uniref:nephrin-like n=1 Tax=Schistocerca nitens TaxID=7011 RepID=UPI002117F7D6|nr:nephrin-like [Schistocerca nitens]